jgi:hypothetical protein
VSVAAARVDGDRRPVYYVIDARGNGGSIALNRLLAAGLAPSWVTEGIELQGRRYAPGSIVVAHSKQSQALVQAIAEELGLAATGVRGRMPAAMIPLGRPRVALYKPWVENIDEGWTRWLLERYEFAFANISDADVRRGGLRARFDAIILPDATPDRLLSGHPSGAVPEEYTGGMGEEGAAALKAFVETGGTLITLDSSSTLAINLLNLPVRDVAQAAGPGEFFCPGSILALDVDTSNPLAFGMTPRAAAFFAYSAAYDVTTPLTTDGHTGGASLPSIDIVGRYATRDVLMSGWLEGERVIAGRGAVLHARVGLGRAVLLGFRAQHRAQAHNTFRLLFNAIHTSAR